MRKPRLFQAEHLQYAEIGALDAAITPLLAAGWVSSDPDLRIDDLFALFTKPQLLQLLKFTRADAQLGKRVLFERSKALAPTSRKLGGWTSNDTTRIFKLNVAEVCDRLRLLYFGNFRQSWSEFVLADMGLTRFEQFDLTLTRPFTSRRQWDEFETIFRCRESLSRDASPTAVLAAVPGRIDQCEWLETKRQRLLFRIGQALEKIGDRMAALSLYASISHPGAAVRAIRIRESDEDAAAALSACEAALAVCRHDEDGVRLGRARHRLMRRLAIEFSPSGRPRTSLAPPVMDLMLEQPAGPYSVEVAVSECLMRQDPEAEVYYVENCLINSLFGLLCWRALFAPVAGAFFHPFHREPADLLDTHFFERRQEMFARCLAELDQGTYRQTMLDTFAAKQGIHNTFVAWPVIDARMIEQTLACVSPLHLKPWFERMAKNYRANRNGFPDLIQLWPRQRRYRLIEVKAPGDRLQDNQRRVLALCTSFQIPVTVCRVVWRDRS